jgi:peptidoglycan hydrolase CwlO-like protein
MAKSQKVASLIEKKRKISKEIEDLQSECNHLNKSIKSIRERVDSTTFVIRWICDDCEKTIGIPNDQEINKYLNGSR